MSDPASKGKRSATSKTGETARELLRWTRQIPRRKFPAEEKIRILLEGIRAELSVAELCRREGIHPTVCYHWLKGFMEAGKARMRGNSLRDATTAEVGHRKGENERLKQLVAELSLQNLMLKKAWARAPRPTAVRADARRAEAGGAQAGAAGPGAKQQSLAALGLPRSTYCRWQLRGRQAGDGGLMDRRLAGRQALRPKGF